MPSAQPPLALSDGTLLYHKRWLEKIQLIGILYIIHGLGEHSGRYEKMARKMNSWGFRVHSIDLRGHGRSHRDLDSCSKSVKGHIGDIGRIKDDISEFLRIDKEVDTPKFLLGHSMGGLAVIDYITSQNIKDDKLDFLHGVIASAPALAIPKPIGYWTERIGRFVGWLWPSFNVRNGLDYRLVSRDEQYCRTLHDDPLLHHGISLGTASTFLDLGKKIRDEVRLKKSNVPLLISHGTGDVFTSHEASQSFISLINCSDKKIKLYENGYHNLHQDIIGDQVMKDYYDWMVERI